ncbi:MAG: D-alanine--D-alanine ligase [Candidatus Lernaella stagnicola]|nr:D-alanine--D-alanine ligase [Candidatus Lernaella stagnicola]
MHLDKKIGVLMGGASAERDISLQTGAAVATALRAKGYEVVELDLNETTAHELISEKVQIVYNALHGKWGEDGCVQGMLEIMRVPYTGSGVMSSAVGMDKVVSKTLFQMAGLPVPAYEFVSRKARLLGNVSPPDFGFPIVVKPATEGSSVGIAIVGDAMEFDAALEEAFEYDDRVLLEQYVAGREMSVAVLADRALGIVEIRPKPVEGKRFTFYDYEHKYTKGMTEYITHPEGLTDEVHGRMRELAVLATQTLQGEGVVRVDFILDHEQQPWLLEVNTLPGLTELSLVPMIAHDWAGMEFGDLVQLVLSTARLKVGS